MIKIIFGEFPKKNDIITRLWECERKIKELNSTISEYAQENMALSAKNKELLNIFKQILETFSKVLDEPELDIVNLLYLVELLIGDAEKCLGNFPSNILNHSRSENLKKWKRFYKKK